MSKPITEAHLAGSGHRPFDALGCFIVQYMIAYDNTVQSNLGIQGFRVRDLPEP